MTRQFSAGVMCLSLLLGTASVVSTASSAHAFIEDVDVSTRNDSPVATPSASPQTDGVAWDGAIGSDSGFVVGNISNAWDVDGTKRAVSNFVAFDLASGRLMPRLPSFNGEIKTVALSDDRSTVYLGGLFTRVNGVPRYRLAALDASTLSLKPWAPSSDYLIHDIEILNNTAYIGGKFSNINGVARTNVAALDATSGQLLPWYPRVDGRVLSISASRKYDAVALGGQFTRIGWAIRRGWGVVGRTNATAQFWSNQDVMDASGDGNGIYSIKNDGDNFYAVGYSFGRGFFDNRFEGAAKYNIARRGLDWVYGCWGDTYDVAVTSDSVLLAGHQHDCEGLKNGIPFRKPWIYNPAMAVTKERTQTNTAFEKDWVGLPAPEVADWNVQMRSSDFTGLNQKAWSVETADGWTMLAGEFDQVMGKDRRGIALFRHRNRGGVSSAPVRPASLQVSLNEREGTADISVPINHDPDNRALTYAISVNGKVVATKTADSQWFDEGNLSFSGIPLDQGKNEVSVIVRDADGTSISATEVVQNGEDVDGGNGGDGTAYSKMTSELRAQHYWRFDDNDVEVPTDPGSARLSKISSTEASTEPGHVGNGLSINSPKGGYVAPPSRSPKSFTYELWAKISGPGTLVAFGSDNTADPTYYDRILGVTNDGKIAAGVFDGRGKTIVGPFVQDGKWHHIAMRSSLSTGTALYVDGRKVREDSNMRPTLDYSGFVRLGGVKSSQWGIANNYVANAVVDEFAIYGRALRSAEVKAHFESAQK